MTKIEKIEEIISNIKSKNDLIREKDTREPINEDIKMDMPYIVKKDILGYIEIPLTFSDEEYDVLLKRQPLKYEDGTIVHSVDELRPDTWIWAFAQIDSNDRAVIEMQIDGASETQGPYEFLVLTGKEVKTLLSAAEERCKRSGFTLEYLKSHINDTAKPCRKKEEIYMKTDEIIQNLQCFIDLSLFDGTHGETIPKECLDFNAQIEVTACEEAIKLINGADAKSLAMPINHIASVLDNLAMEFNQHIKEIQANGHGEGNPIIPLERDNAEVFKAVAEGIKKGMIGKETISREDR